LPGAGIIAIIVSRLMRGESGHKGSGAEGERENPVPFTRTTTLVASTASPNVAGGSINFSLSPHFTLADALRVRASSGIPETRRYSR